MTVAPGSPKPNDLRGQDYPTTRPRRPLGKSLLLWTRTLHIYVTMLGLILLIFFSFTGFLLNNGGTFSNSGKFINLDKTALPDRTVKVPMKLLSGNEHLIAIEGYLRKQAGARGDLDGTPDEGDGAIHFTFNAPGRSISYDIALDTGETKVHEERNLLATLTDLHTGEHSGKVWVWFIDAAAVFLFFASVSGLVLWLSLPKRRVLGIVALVVGLGLCLGAYFLLVP